MDKVLSVPLTAITTPQPVLEVFLGIVSLVVIILVHGVGIRIINRRFSRSWVHVTVRTPRWRVNLVLSRVIGALAALHMFETLLIAVPLQFTDAFDSLRDSYYYVMESYTTLGEGNLTLPEKWRLIGPIIAMAGLFTFGWTGSVLVSVMNQFGKYDNERAGQSEAEAEADQQQTRRARD